MRKHHFHHENSSTGKELVPLFLRHHAETNHISIVRKIQNSQLSVALHWMDSKDLIAMYGIN